MQKFITAAFISVLAVTGWMATSNLREASPIEYNGTATISGIVTDDVIGQPIIGAQIALNNTDWFTTDSLGQFTIDKLPQGAYSLLVKAEGYTDQEMSITLTEGENKIVSISMSLATLISADTAITEFEQVYENENLKRKSVMANQESLTFGYATMDAPAISFRGDVYDEDVDGNYNTESYNAIQETGFKEAISNPLSTFSIDVDNASYSNIRRMINYGQQIPADAVRIEEMVNYFDYTYAQPTNNDPFAVQYELGTCPWNSETSLVMIGIQGKDIDYSKTAASNLVFLIDVSGSMQSENKLPLVKSSLTKLIDNLKPTDRVALVVYAGAAGEVLPSTPCSNSSKIKSALNQLEAGGSTAGGAGIQLAYEIATKNFIEGGNNRVILCTDGDFNVGSSSDGEMTKLIEEKRKTGVFITVCGFGMGNYKDSKMESIADNGNGAYYYIDDKKEAEKVFGTDLRGTLFTIAKDVKIQIEFNPVMVESYRLIGYENRILNKEDFDNDAKDAGELGAGHRVTALYEIKRRTTPSQPTGMQQNTIQEDLKYQSTTVKSTAYSTNELMTLKLRYKAPDGNTSKLIEKSLFNQPMAFAATSDNFRFASAVTEFGMILRNSEFKGDADINEVLQLASGAKGADKYGYRDEFIQLVKQYAGTTAKN